MKKASLALGLALMLALLSACAQVANPLERAQATAVPGLDMRLHVAQADPSGDEMHRVTLYFRYLDEPLLAAEEREITVRKDESLEMAIVQALLEGPAAGRGELNRLLPEDVEVESVVSRGETLFVTFSDALLRTGELPADWATRAEWSEEAPLRRQLAIASIVASITDSAPYGGVQILVHRQGQAQESLRLENSFFLSGQQGLSEPQHRREKLLLTPGNAMAAMQQAWQEKNWERLYRYVSAAESGGVARPGEADFRQAMDALPTLLHAAASAGVTDGSSAVVCVTDERRLPDGTQTAREAFPVLLQRESGVWRVTYVQLLRLMGAEQ